MDTLSGYRAAARALSRRLEGFTPEFLLILGSGLADRDELTRAMDIHGTVPYGQVPHMMAPTAPGHEGGAFVAGTLAGRRVLLMKGRLHAYEGYTAAQVAFPVRVARLLGTRGMIVTNAAGAVNTAFGVGEAMLITDFIKFSGPNPLTGPNLDELGTRFPDMGTAFDPEYGALLRQTAKQAGIALREGVYFYMTGPQYETPAEIRAIRVLGGDAVGMSTVYEVLAAHHCGMRTLGISLLSNMAAGVLDQALSGTAVNRAAAEAAPRMLALIAGFLERAQL